MWIGNSKITKAVVIGEYGFAAADLWALRCDLHLMTKSQGHSHAAKLQQPCEGTSNDASLLSNRVVTLSSSANVYISNLLL